MLGPSQQISVQESRKLLGQNVGMAVLLVAQYAIR